jgi:hypothetical protein
MGEKEQAYHFAWWHRTLSEHGELLPFGLAFFGRR